MNYTETRTLDSRPEFVQNSTKDIIVDNIVVDLDNNSTTEIVVNRDQFTKTTTEDFKNIQKVDVEKTINKELDKLHCIKTNELNIPLTKVKVKNNHPTIFNTNQLNNIVEHPDHYGAGNGGLQCIEAMLQTFGKQATLDFCKLNAFKYIWRSDHKTKEVQDMEKAKRYLEYWHVLNKLEGETDDGSFHNYLNS